MGKRLLLFGILALSAGFAATANGHPVNLGPATASAASLTCDQETAALCTISSQKIVTMAPGGSETISVDRNLLITDGGLLKVWIPDKGASRTFDLVVAGSITLTGTGAISGDAGDGAYTGASLNVTADGKIDLQDQSRISANSFGPCLGNGRAGAIHLSSAYTSAARNDAAISVGSQASILASAVQEDGQTEQSCPAGDISLSAPNGDILIAGHVESAVPAGSTDTQRLEDGGSITIDAGCKLTIPGLVSSRGRDNGSDLVHLQGGCSVEISGTVESKGPGNVPLAHNSCHGDDRPDKAPAATSCVEVWSGGDLSITGSVDADLCCYGGSVGDSWIDLYAASDISIDGTAAWAVHADGLGGQYDNGGAITIVSSGGSVKIAEKGVSSDGSERGGVISIAAAKDVSITGGTGTYAVHADGDIGGYDGGSGGNVSLRSYAGTITAKNSAIDASAGGNRAAGGSINLLAPSTVTLDGATLLASGDWLADSGYGTGGTISVRSVDGRISWTPSGLADVRPAGSQIDLGSDGAIFLTYCKAVETTGASFPSVGDPDPQFPTAKSDCITGSGDALTLPDYVLLPATPGAEQDGVSR